MTETQKTTQIEPDRSKCWHKRWLRFANDIVALEWRPQSPKQESFKRVRSFLKISAYFATENRIF